jgi:hypothetical protein
MRVCKLLESTWQPREMRLGSVKHFCVVSFRRGRRHRIPRINLLLLFC